MTSHDTVPAPAVDLVPTSTSDPTQDSPVLVRRGGGLAHVTLNRPSVVNALTAPMMRDLVSVLKDLERDPDVGAVVLSGAGRGFNSGWDRGPSGAAHTPAAVLAIDDLGRQVMEVLASMRTFTVARLHGAVVGGGVLLAAACDFRIAARSSFFWLPEIGFGNPMFWTGLAPLVREIGVSRTRYLAMTNERCSAEWALSTGLVHEVMEADELDARVEEFCHGLVQIPERGVRLMKEDLARVAADGHSRHGHSAAVVYESLTADTFASA
jgi:methylglutaconyl-CoA hydratase